MKFLIKRLAFLVAILAISQSCQDVVQLDVPEIPASIAVDGRVTDSDTVGTSVILSTTAGYFDQGQTPRITGADVFLFEDEVMVSQLSENRQAGEYSSSFQGEVGKSYFIEIQIPADNDYGLEESTWRSRPEMLNRVFQIDSLTVEFLERPDVFTAGDYPLMYFREPAGKGEYYRTRIWDNDSAVTQNILIFEDEFFDGLYVGDDVLPPFNFYGRIEAGDSITAEVSSMTKAYFDYLTLLQEQVLFVGGPFDPPPAPIIGNIYNVDDEEAIGFGYFTAAALEVEWVVNE